MLADAVVLGAGPAGSAAAIGLLAPGRALCFISEKPMPNRKSGEIIEPIFRITLAELGLSQALATVNSLALRAMFRFVTARQQSNPRE